MTPSEMTIQSFMDDWGNSVAPCRMDHKSYLSRYWFFRET